MSQSEILLVSVVGSIFGVIILYQFRPAKVTGGLGKLIRVVLRLSILTAILMGVAYIQIPATHFAVTWEWTRTIISITIASIIAGYILNVVMNGVERLK